MTDAISPSRPAWQTDELEDEWIEPDDDDPTSHGTLSVSLTEPLLAQIRRSLDEEPEPEQQVGTFLVRQDVPAAPLLPKTPGRPKAGLIKNFFSPLPLERMFEPPSPPVASNPSSQSILHEYESTHKPSLDGQFTFSVPRNDSLTPTTFPQAQSTPAPPANATSAPVTDPRLRLFQFQYDTFTRDHLSAIVDSIAVNTPSGGSGTGNDSPTSFSNALSKVSEAATPGTPRLRSTKRVKLSPASDYYGEGEGAGAVIARPKIMGKDYVGESRSLMQQIKQARDFSTISTTTSGHSPQAAAPNQTPEARPAFLDIPDTHSAPSSGGTSKRGSYSSLAFRQQAADLMAQIKSDMKGQKRLFSDGTDISRVTHAHADRSLPDSQPATARVKAERGDEVGELAGEVSNMSIEPSWQEPPRRVSTSRSISTSSHSSHSTTLQHPAHTTPSHLSSALRLNPTDDLNRFVSSSTASGGTTLTAGSAPSFVKHAGPVQMTRIAPEDVPALPERVGRMVFDRVAMRWVKEGGRGAVGSGGGDDVYGGAGDEGARGEGTDGESEDPFRDFESLREDDSERVDPGVRDEREHEHDGRELGLRTHEGQIMSIIEEEADEEEAGLNSFSFDALPGGVEVLTGSEDVDDATTDSDSSDDQVTSTGTNTTGMSTGTGTNTEQEDAVDSEEESPVDLDGRQSAHTIPFASFATPHRPSHPTTSSASTHTPAPRSALKSTSTSNTPVSALKDPSKWYRTPAHLGHRRSVSFSDGRRDGPIRGLGRENENESVDMSFGGGLASAFVPSARSKRIAEMMEGLEDDEFDNDLDADARNEVSPSKARLGKMRRPHASPSRSPNANTSRSPRRVFSRAHTHRPQHASGNTTTAHSFVSTRSKHANTTDYTLTFPVAHDRLVSALTDAEPYEPYWETLSFVDLAGKGIESVVRMGELVPALDGVNLNDNQISWLSGVPSSVRTMCVASNVITGMTSFGHLMNLEFLDVSRNAIDSLRQLECLKHLRELRADGNEITSVDGLQGMDGLVKLSLEGNEMREMELGGYRWTRLEMLNVKANKLRKVVGLEGLVSLISFNAEKNELETFEVGAAMSRMRILRLSENRLRKLDVSMMSGLRTLYVDENRLGRVSGIGGRVENVSLRNESGLDVDMKQLRDVKRLYLSGNALGGFLQERCYNLVYLELAGCRLKTLPKLRVVTPNLRVLNLNYNFIEDVSGLEGLTRLCKLSMVGSRIRSRKGVVRVLRGMDEMTMMDLRMNPITEGMYLPLFVPEGGDVKFRRDLPDAEYIGRLVYRGLVMRECKGITRLDGIQISEKEKKKAFALVQAILSK